MKALETMVPCYGNCSHKIKKEGPAKDEYYCDVLIDTPIKSVVTIDTDVTHYIKLDL